MSGAARSLLWQHDPCPMAQIPPLRERKRPQPTGGKQRNNAETGNWETEATGVHVFPSTRCICNTCVNLQAVLWLKLWVCYVERHAASGYCHVLSVFFQSFFFRLSSLILLNLMQSIGSWPDPDLQLLISKRLCKMLRFIKRRNLWKSD